MGTSNEGGVRAAMRQPYTWLPGTKYDIGELLAALGQADGVLEVRVRMQRESPRWTRFAVVVAGGEHDVLRGVVDEGMVSRLEYVSTCPLYIVRRAQDQIEVLG